MYLEKSPKELKPLLSKEEDAAPMCILCVGSTGSGKSATLSKITRLPIQSNSGAGRVTTKCSLYKRPNDRMAWLDTVGWDDSVYDDDEIFKDILRSVLFETP